MKNLYQRQNIFLKIKNEYNPNNKNLVKVSDECNNKFGNNYTHGGYECGDDGKWTNKCVPSYCDPGYFFNKRKEKCIKDICSSIPIKIINKKIKEVNETIDETNKIVNETKDEQSNKKNSYGKLIYFNSLYIFLSFSYIKYIS